MYMKMLNDYSRKYNFKFGFVTEFDNVKLGRNINLSDVAVVGTNVKSVLNNVETVMCFVFKYDKININTDIAYFARCDEYQTKIRKILNNIAKHFNDAIILVDNNIINERYYAAKAGLGFIGKNSLLINDEYGSFCYIALILTSDKIVAPQPKRIESKCGDCNLCEIACPAKAIINNTIDCDLCHAELLQRKKNLHFSTLSTNIYGCDICQNVCPHNKNVQSVDSSELAVKIEENLFLSKREYKEKYIGKTFYWIGYRSFIRNVHVSYIKKYHDCSNLWFLEQSNSEYLRDVARLLRREYD